MARLNAMDPDADDFLSRLSEQTQRNFSATLVTRMLVDAGINPTTFRPVLENGPYGDTPVRAEVWAQLVPWEQKYRHATRTGDTAESERTRMPARALSAAHYALDANAEEAAHDVVDVAVHAYGREKAREIIANLLNARRQKPVKPTE